jgi:hypothetical protein
MIIIYVHHIIVLVHVTSVSGRIRTLDLRNMRHVFYHCATRGTTCKENLHSSNNPESQDLELETGANVIKPFTAVIY